MKRFEKYFNFKASGFRERDSKTFQSEKYFCMKLFSDCAF